jgi:hypothetical protein
MPCIPVTLCRCLRTEKTLHVYIGSASKCHGGVNFGKSHMLSRFTCYIISCCITTCCIRPLKILFSWLTSNVKDRCVGSNIEYDLIRPAHLIVVPFDVFLFFTPCPPAVFVLWFEEWLLTRTTIRFAGILKDFAGKIAAELFRRLRGVHNAAGRGSIPGRGTYWKPYPWKLPRTCCDDLPRLSCHELRLTYSY